MLTGNKSYLDIADKALQFMYDYTWDKSYGGWFNTIDKSGGTRKTNTKTAFDQHYALLAIAAYYEATNDSYEVILDGSGLSSGVYFYRLQVGEFVQTINVCL